MSTDASVRRVWAALDPAPLCAHTAVIYTHTGDPARLECTLSALIEHDEHVGNIKAEDQGTAAGDTPVSVFYMWTAAP